MEVLPKANRQILSTRAEESIALEDGARRSFSAHTEGLQNRPGITELVEQYCASRTDSFEQKQDHSDFLQKGWKAHKILICAWLALLPASGLPQAYLLTHQLKPHSAVQVSCIFSVNVFSPSMHSFFCLAASKLVCHSVTLDERGVIFI